MRRLGIAIACSLLVLAPPLARGAELIVHAAASLTEPVKELTAAYHSSSDDKVQVNLGASSMLERQIEEGAPADLFLSADEAKMDALEKRGLVLAGTRRSVLSNTLVVVVPTEGQVAIATAEDLAAARVKSIALAEPDTVPAGIYAKAWLRKAGIWSRVVGKVVPVDNVRAVLAAVETGNVDAGVVYRTDALVSKGAKVAFEVPAADTPAISYPFAVVKTSAHPDAAKALLEFLESPASLEVFRRHGFVVR